MTHQVQKHRGVAGLAGSDEHDHRAAGLVPVTDLDDSPLSAEEIAYGQASKASATIEACRTGWQEFCDWCTSEHHDPSTAPPAAVSGYLTTLAQAGAKVSSMSWRMAAIRFFHALQNLPDPTSPDRSEPPQHACRRPVCRPRTAACPWW